MGKTIKTREVVAKSSNSPVSVVGQIKRTAGKAKEKITENTSDTNANSPEQYATEKVADTSQSTAENAMGSSGDTVKKAVVKKVRQKSKQKNTKKHKPVDDNSAPADSQISESTVLSESKSEKQDKPDVKPKKKADKPADKIALPRQRKQSVPKTKGQKSVKKANDEKAVRKVVTADNQIKVTKRSVDGTRKTVKTAETTAKTTVKGAKQSAETVKRTSEAVVRSKVAVKVAVKSAKATVAVAKAVGKGIAEGATKIGAAIAAGGVPAVVVIVVICLIGAIGGTCFGIFLSNDESTGTQQTMSQTVAGLTAEYYDSLTELQNSYSHDIFEIQSESTINWKETLAVYSIKTTSGSNPLEVVTLNDDKIELLRGILNDMNPKSPVLSTRYVNEPITATDADGNPITRYVSRAKTVLTVSILQLSADEIATLYNFNEEQRNMLTELLSSEYDALWGELISQGGQIINSNSMHTPKGIFKWPFESTQIITSYFGTRVDPISGEVKTHKGLDIAAPMGTPILAAAAGTVVTASYDAGGYGYYVKILHNGNYHTLYGHCSALYVSVGQTVQQGQVIAACGSTGYSTGPHCHFEVYQNGTRVNPLKFFS